MARNSPDPICPKCGSGESVRKVSVAALSSSAEDLALARRISPPGQPKYRSPWGVWSKAAIGLLVLGLAAMLIATEENVSRLWAAGAPADPLLAYLVLSNVIFLFPIALVVARKERERAVRQLELSVRMEAWGRAVDQWEQLYHCGECDSVFTRDQYLMPTGEMERLLQDSVERCEPPRVEEFRLAG